MTADWLRRVLVRDLDSLATQVRAYPSDGDLWRPTPGATNPGGTLALHLTGNLRHFVGAQLGASGYVRNRDEEFSARGLSREDLLGRIAAARKEVDQALSRTDDAVLTKEYPLEVGGVRLATGLLLVHVATHFAYHLGQLDLHRRTVTGAGSLPGMQAPAALTAS